MKINKSSWHYRWMKFLHTQLNARDWWTAPNTVCSYFWTFVGLNLKGLFGIATILVFFGAVLAFVSLVPLLFWSWLHNHSHNAGMGLGLMAMIALVFVLYYLFCLGCQKWNSGSLKPKSGFTKVILETLKAAKNKVCPFIQYEE